MKSYGIDMIGRFVLERVDTRPTFDVDRDKGRLIYDKTVDQCYGGRTSDWVSLSPDYETLNDHESRISTNETDISSLQSDYNDLESRVSTNETDISGLKNNVIESGTKMLFKQSSAPTGWTFVSEDNDRAIINTSTEGDGGNTGGNWTISGISVNGHSLSISEMPSHDHGMSSNGGHTHSDAELEFPDCDKYSTGTTTGISKITCDGGGTYGDGDHISIGGAAGNHYHNIYNRGGNNSHNHGLSIDGNGRPAYTKVITCQKD